MPLELEAITEAFGLAPTGDVDEGVRCGQVGPAEVTAIHIGMGPPATRTALCRLFDGTSEGVPQPDHVMIAGICGGLDPSVDVGTVVNPEIVVDLTSGSEFVHRPPGSAPRSGKLLTVEEATVDGERHREYLSRGFLAVDMESAAVAEVCEERGCPWSVFRCIGDRLVDGLLDDRVLAMTNPDGSGNPDEIARLLAADPALLGRLEQLGRDATMAARRAADAAFRGCQELVG